VVHARAHRHAEPVTGWLPVSSRAGCPVNLGGRSGRRVSAASLAGRVRPSPSANPAAGRSRPPLRHLGHSSSLASAGARGARSMGRTGVPGQERRGGGRGTPDCQRYGFLYPGIRDFRFPVASPNTELDLWFLRQVGLVALQANTLLVCLVASDSLPDPDCGRAVPPPGCFFAPHPGGSPLQPRLSGRRPGRCWRWCA
jgi:hypothetical protein